LENKFDVIIVGSGPSGCSCGIVLAKNNLKTLIIEKKKLPRHKICSGLISKESQRSLKKIGLKFPEVLCVRPKRGKGIKVQFVVGRDFIEVPDKFYNVYRRDFDFWLAIEANKAGVLVQDETELIDIKFENKDTIKLIVKSKDQNTGKNVVVEYYTKYVIGADGATSPTRKIIYPDFKRDIGVAYQEYWAGTIDLDPNYFYAFMDRELSAGYAFCNMKNDVIIIGVGAEKGKNIKKYQSKFINFLEHNFGLKLDKMIRREGTISTNIFSTNPVFQYLHGKNNVLLVGEAADLFNIMGEGIPAAIQSGINAANSILEHNKDESKDVVDIYLKMNEKLVEKLRKNWDGFKKQYDQLTKL